jgi:hypothetical protein
MSNTHVNLGPSSETILTTYWEITSSASGTLSFPTGSELVSDAFQGLEEGVVSKTSSGKPTFEAAVSSGGSRCVVSIDAFGSYSISPTPSAYPVAILYRVKQPLSSFNPDNAVLEDVERAGGGGTIDSASNVGGGYEVFKDLNGTDLRFRTLTAGSNVTITQNANTIEISSSGGGGGGNSYFPGGW